MTLEKGHGRIERRDVRLQHGPHRLQRVPPRAAGRPCRAHQMEVHRKSTASAADQPLFREVSCPRPDAGGGAARLARITPAGPPPPTSGTAASTEYLGRLVRGHREIESLLWLRDRNFREDESQAPPRPCRLGPGPLTAPPPLRSGVLCAGWLTSTEPPATGNGETHAGALVAGHHRLAAPLAQHDPPAHPQPRPAWGHHPDAPHGGDRAGAPRNDRRDSGQGPTVGDPEPAARHAVAAQRPLPLPPRRRDRGHGAFP